MARPLDELPGFFISKAITTFVELSYMNKRKNI